MSDLLLSLISAAGILWIPLYFVKLLSQPRSR